MSLHQDILTILKIVSQMEITDQERSVFIELMHKESILNKQHILLAEINNHRLQYLFFKHLKESHCLFDTLSKKNIITLSEQFAFLQTKHREYLESIKPVICELNDSNIPYVLIKGFHLLDIIYQKKNEYYRTYGDCDLLVAKKDVKKISAILESNGYIQGEINDNYKITKSSRENIIFWSLSSHQEHKFIKESINFSFSPRLVLCIDVNTTIFEGGKYEPPITTDNLLNLYAQIYNNSFINYYILTPTLELVQLCYHFYKDTQYESKKQKKDDFSLIKFCDIREFIKTNLDSINWEEFFEIIESFEIIEQIMYVLNLVFDFYQDECIKNIIEKHQYNYKKTNTDYSRLLINFCEEYNG